MSEMDITDRSAQATLNNFGSSFYPVEACPEAPVSVRRALWTSVSTCLLGLRSKTVSLSSQVAGGRGGLLGFCSTSGSKSGHVSWAQSGQSELSTTRVKVEGRRYDSPAR